MLNCRVHLEKENSALLFHDAGDGVHEVEFGEDFEFAVGHFDEDGGAGMAEEMGDALDGRIAGDARKCFGHDFADDEFAQIFPLQREIQNLVLVNRADGIVVLENRQLRNVLLLHDVQRVKNGLIGASDDELAMLAVLQFDANDVGGAKRDFGFDVAVLAHPAVVVNFAEIPHAGVGEEGDNDVALGAFAREAQRR